MSESELDRLIQDIQESVEHGVTVLDRYFGSRSVWASKLDHLKLDMYDIHRCILGQLFGSYYDGCCILDIEHPDDVGFACDDLEGRYSMRLREMYRILTSTWNDAVNMPEG